jgi:hypothetical protein
MKYYDKFVQKGKRKQSILIILGESNRCKSKLKKKKKKREKDL